MNSTNPKVRKALAESIRGGVVGIASYLAAKENRARWNSEKAKRRRQWKANHPNGKRIAELKAAIRRLKYKQEESK